MEQNTPSGPDNETPPAAGSGELSLPVVASSSPPPLPEKDRIPGLESRIEEESQSRRAIEVTVPAAVFEEAVQAELRKIRQRAHLRGFRKGKAPRERIERLYGADATEEAVRKLLSRATRQSLHGTDLHPLDMPKATPTAVDRGGPLTARLTFSIWPDIGTVDYSGIEATARDSSVTESDIGETLEQMRLEKATPGPITGRGIQDDDFVAGDLEETEESDDAEASGAPTKTEGVGLRVGSGAYHPALHEALQGAQLGDTIIATVQFGAESPDAERAGRKLRAQFTIKEASAPVLPPLDDEFAQQFGAASLLALRGDIRDRLRKRAAQEDRRDVANQLMDALLTKNPVEPPAPLVERDLETRLRILANSMARGGMPPEQVKANLEQHLPAMRADCEKAVASTILIDALADQETIEADEDTASKRIAERVEAEAKAAGKAVAVIEAAMEKEGHLERMRTELRREATIDFLREQATVHSPPEVASV